MKKERIFEIGGDGGSLTIYRELRDKAFVYIYNHNETDFSDEGLDILVNNEFTSFESAFELIKRYPLPYLYLEYCHPEYRKIVAEAIIQKLNDSYGKVEPEFDNQRNFEHKLKVNFNLSKKNVASEYFEITVKSLENLNQCDYQTNHIEDKNSKEITEPWLKSTKKDIITIDKFEGTFDIQYHSIIIKDYEGRPIKIYPSDKFIVDISPIFYYKTCWEFSS